MSLPGKSKEIIVEPIETPVEAPPDPEPVREPVPAEPEPVPV